MTTRAIVTLGLVALLAVAVTTGWVLARGSSSPGDAPDFGVSGLPDPGPLGTSFTYQGRLTDDGAPANGTYDLEFKLFIDTGGAGQTGPTLPVADVQVVEGLFTVQLDFGPVFDGRQFYLEIGVRPEAETGAYTALIPCQPITGAPYACTPWTSPMGR